MIAPDKTSNSPHFNSGRPSGVGVVIHSTRSGKPNYAFELVACMNWFANPASQVSSHWIIGRQGEKVRVIQDHLQAWHAGAHNATHWGIELEQGVESDGFTDAQIDALVEVCKGYVSDFGVSPVHSPSTTISGFIGHQETTQGKGAGKTDPGNLFPWERFIAGLNPQAPVYAPGDVAMACVSAAHFTRMNWNLGDLLPSEKEILRWIASQV